MNKDFAVIESDKIRYDFSKKLCGLYNLERNILILAKVGFKEIILNLSDNESDFFETKVRKHLKKIKNCEIITDNKSSEKTKGLVLKSNLFLQAHHFDNEDSYFKNNKAIENQEQFLMSNKVDYKKATKLVSQHIINNTGGFIAQKINKRISIPISLQVAKTRIHPNYLTIFNLIIGVLASVFLWKTTDPTDPNNTNYLYVVLGGFLFQLASILDGVDGEVAKFTFKVSKIGGWLDTIGDNSTLLMFLVSASYLNYIYMGGTASLIFILFMFIGITVMVGIMVNFLSKFSESGSLVAFDKEFLQTIPQDRLVKTAHALKYITKKELFSLLFFLVALTGKIYIIVPFASFSVIVAAIILIVIHLRHIDEFKKRFEMKK